MNLNKWLCIFGVIFFAILFSSAGRASGDQVNADLICSDIKDREAADFCWVIDEIDDYEILN